MVCEASWLSLKKLKSSIFEPAGDLRSDTLAPPDAPKFAAHRGLVQILGTVTLTLMCLASQTESQLHSDPQIRVWAL